jgi:beta-galactosidase
MNNASDSPTLPMLFLAGERTWEMPQLPSLNKLPPHAVTVPFASPEQALTMNRDASPWFQPLDGDWEFKILPRPEAATEQVIREDGWSSIAVPGSWTMQGFGKPQYTNVQMPFPNTPPDVPDDNPTGVYRRTFGTPAHWDGRRVILHIAGCEGALYVYVNGEAVGMSKDARTPAEFDVSAHVHSGPDAENELVCVVTRWSDASFIEDQDHWWHSGIMREVFLYATARPQLQDLYARCEFNDDFSAATLKLTLHVGFPGEEYRDGHSVAVQLFDAAGQPVFAEPLSAPCLPPLNPIAWFNTAVRTKVELSASVNAPALWSHETPNLYTIVATLKGPSGDEVHATRFGFRKVEIAGTDLLINGRRVLINGVNYHDHDDTTGKAISRATMEADLRLMKQFNVNAVRTAHYPKDAYWYELCDRYGMYLIDEANIEAHAYYNEICSDMRYTNHFVERVRAMVERDKNYPSIILWSLGNESGYGPNHDAAAGYVRHAEPTRPLHYEGAITRWFGKSWDGGRAATDVICPMYPYIHEIVDWAREGKGNRPLIMCEYSHTMGNSNGCLADYYEAFEKYPGLQGGFLWEWLDHGIRRTTDDGEAHWAYGGDFGETVHDANFITDGIVWPDRTPHPALYEFKHLARPCTVDAIDAAAGRVRIVSREYFRSLSWLRGEWELLVDGAPAQRGALPALDVAPGGGLETTLPLQRPATGEQFLNFYFYQREKSWWAEAGHEVARVQIVLPIEATPATPPTPAGRVAVLESAATVALEAAGVRAVFARSDGRLIEFGGAKNLVVAGPSLNVWRAGTDNDGIKLMLYPHTNLQRWLNQKLDRVVQRLERMSLLPGDAPVLEVVYSASGREQWDDFTHTMRFTLSPTGELSIDNHVVVGNGLNDIPRVGVSMALDPALESLEWYGRGPWENYADRRASALIGRFGGTVTDQHVPYIMPQENGHKTDVRWLRLGDANAGLHIAGTTPFEFNTSHFTDHDLFAAKHTYELEPRSEVILHLDAAHRGIGSASVGQDTLPKYQLLEKEYRFEFRLTADR